MILSRCLTLSQSLKSSESWSGTLFLTAILKNVYYKLSYQIQKYFLCKVRKIDIKTLHFYIECKAHNISINGKIYKYLSFFTKTY